MTATRPQPRPGVLDIAPYVPGKSSAPGVAKRVQALLERDAVGAEPERRRRLPGGGRRGCEDYPDGAATALRDGDRRARSGSTRRASSAAPAPTTCSICWRTPICADGDEAIHTTHGFLMYPIARSAPAPSRSSRRRRITPPTSTPSSRAVTPRTQHRVPRQPEQPDRHLCAVRRGQAAAAGAAGATCCWCSTRPMPNTSSATTTKPASSWSPPCDNVVMCRTFSKIYGLAALRLGWIYGPAHVVDAVNRVRGPFNVNAPAIAGRHRGDRGHRACRDARARTMRRGWPG